MLGYVYFIAIKLYFLKPKRAFGQSELLGRDGGVQEAVEGSACV